MQIPVTHTTPLATIRRTRMLPEAGRILVRAGQKVAATEAVAESPGNRQHILVDVRRALGLRSTEEADRLILRKVGEVLEKGDVIAESKGLFTRLVRAPQESTLVAAVNGQVLLRVEGAPRPILAGLSAQVVEVIPEHGVILENCGALVQGMWGNERVDQGMLVSLSDRPQDELTTAALDISMRGAVLLGGICTSAETLRAAADMSLRGMILASMPAELVPAARALPFPLILVEGFGQAPMNQTAFKLLKSNERREVCLNAERMDPLSGTRPEIFIPLNSGAALAPETADLVPGKTVRIKTRPYQGHTGTVVKIHDQAVALNGGLRSQAVVLKLENQEQVTVPLKNIDLLE